MIGQRVLIVEDEILIALDMQRALEAAGAKEIVIARDLDEVAALGEAIGNFDLIILPPPTEADQQRPVVAAIAASGAAILVCSGFHGSIDGSPLAGAEFLDKPFADDELVAACARALARNKQRVS